MEQRKLLVFFVISMAIWMAWMNFAVPALFPEFAARQEAAMKKAKLDASANIDREPADALMPSNVASEDLTKVKPDVPKHVVLNLLLGPADPDEEKDSVFNERLDEYFIAAGLTSQGAAIDYIELTDKKRYPAFGHRGKRVRVIGSDSRTPLRTFSLTCPQVDKQLGSSTLDRIAWEVVLERDVANAERTATFRFVSPDGRWEIRKRFEITQLSLDQLKNPHIRDTFVDGYEVKLSVTIKNLTNKDRAINYSLQGPVGVPLEDAENSSKYRDVRMGFLRDDGITIDESKLSAAEIVKRAKNKKDPEEWKRKLKYLGVDVLYFASLVIPNPDNVDFSRAVVAKENLSKPERSDVSVELASPTFDVGANSEVTHEYTLFAGPKRKELIGSLSAIAVMDFGWFDAICRGMIWLLNMFHHLGLSYGLAIICLTALVRILMMPISKHQAANAEKMKESQPKIAARQKEIEAKYGKNSEEYVKQVSELSKEQIGTMMSGCLPVFLQLPIFIALYRTIGSSIELRMEPFLWFENLASPDALFAFPFVIPWFGWTHFNLLPCISTGLMFMHQKLTMPPPTNEEQAFQQKTMNFMMIFMGAMFYRVPSGLCLYFIATNVWSMTERWIFQHHKKAKIDNKPADTIIQPASTSTTTTKTVDEKPSALGGIWERLQKTADGQYNASRQLDRNSASRNKKKKKKN